MKHVLPAVLLPFCLAAAARADGFSWGRFLPADRDAKWSVSYGALFGIDGHVDETFRAYYKATGQDEKQAMAESYSFSDFGVEGSYPDIGLHYEKQWKYFSFRGDVLYLSMDADATAKRDYYLGIGDEIKYGGRKYDHLKIPKGSDFSISFDGNQPRRYTLL